MEDALLGGAHHQWLGGVEGGGGGGLIARREGFLDLLDVGAHLAAAGPVHRGATGNLADGLFGRRGVSHCILGEVGENSRDQKIVSRRLTARKVAGYKQQTRRTSTIPREKST